MDNFAVIIYQIKILSGQCRRVTAGFQNFNRCLKESRKVGEKISKKSLQRGQFHLIAKWLNSGKHSDITCLFWQFNDFTWQTFSHSEFPINSTNTTFASFTGLSAQERRIENTRQKVFCISSRNIRYTENAQTTGNQRK